MSTQELLIKSKETGFLTVYAGVTKYFAKKPGF